MVDVCYDARTHFCIAFLFAWSLKFGFFFFYSSEFFSTFKKFEYPSLELTKSPRQVVLNFLLYFLEPVRLLAEKPCWCDTQAHQKINVIHSRPIVLSENEIVCILDNLQNCHNAVIDCYCCILHDYCIQHILCCCMLYKTLSTHM